MIPKLITEELEGMEDETVEIEIWIVCEDWKRKQVDCMRINFIIHITIKCRGLIRRVLLVIAVCESCVGDIVVDFM